MLCPGLRLPFQEMLLAVTLAVDCPEKLAFQLPVTSAGSWKSMTTVQELIAELPLLVTSTSSW